MTLGLQSLSSIQWYSDVSKSNQGQTTVRAANNQGTQFLHVIVRYTDSIGKRNGSCGRKASGPIPATVTAGRVAGLHSVLLTKFPPFAALPLDAWQFI